MQTQAESTWIKWVKFCERSGIKGEHMQTGFQELARRYGESHRHYHTLKHINECLEVYDTLRELCPYSLAIELAIWFHDIVYDTHRKDNEMQSTHVLHTFAVGAGFDEETINLAMACVLVTRHDTAPATLAKQVMIDVDLSILGRDWDSYKKYADQIRKEYNDVPQTLYMLGRKKVMGSFLDRPRIFSTQAFYERFEIQARDNIEREIRELKLF